jgi:hypothetical protein
VTWDERNELVTQYGDEEAVDYLEGYSDLVMGLELTQGPRPLDQDLSLYYYFPDEETLSRPKPERRVDLTRVGIIERRPGRHRAEEGCVYWCGGERAAGHEDRRIYTAPFYPPFRPEDVTLVIEDLSDFGYSGHLVTAIRYDARDPDHVESTYRSRERLGSRFLVDHSG